MIRMFRKIVAAETKPLEIVVSVQSILWGIWMMLPISTFDSSKVFDVMRFWASENVWGAVICILGLVMLYTTHTGNRIRRKRIAVLSFFMWLMIDTAIWLSASYSTAAITNLIFVVSAGWSVISLTADKRGHE